MRRSAKWIATGILSLVLLLSVVLLIARQRSKLPDEQFTPGGLPRSSSTYVKMRDGVEIAVSVDLPADWKTGERLPVLMRSARYWREPQVGWTARMLLALRAIQPDDILDKQALYFAERRFVVLRVDVRGTGASGGHRAMEYSPAEVADIGEVAAWAAQQPWSNGRVGSFGISYEGNTAELAAVPNQPAIRAVMPLYDSFDDYDDIVPGGVASHSLLSKWSAVVVALDHNDVCGANEVKGWKCWRDRLMTPGVRPVDSDTHGEHLARIVKQHNNLNVIEAINKIDFRDDAVSTQEGNYTLGQVSPSGLRDKIESSKVSMMVWCGWLDGEGCTDSLIRYNTLSNPQAVIIGPLSHGGDYNVDPFASNHSPAAPPSDEQLKMEADFFDRVLRNPTPFQSSIRYYTMGEGQWHSTNIWPPAGFTTKRLYFAPQNGLSLTPPISSPSSDTYTVDFTASTGKQTRWHTGYGGGDVVYPDRAVEDKKLLVYNSAPLESDLEITGTPVLTLQLSSTAADGAIHAYLEDVSPGGRVTYLDEGILRVIDRKEVDPHSLPYLPFGPAHSYYRSDAEPLVVGQSATLRLILYSTSILLRKGHRIRLALAGADAGIFERYPQDATPTWTVYREPKRPSFLDVPAKPDSIPSQYGSLTRPPMR
jgi:putative CocE/NonD family hydrolase